MVSGTPIYMIPSPDPTPERVYQDGFYNFDVGLGALAESQFSQNWTSSPLSSLSRSNELNDYLTGTEVDPNQPVFRGPPRRIQTPRVNSPMLTADEANARFGIPGALSFNEPIREKAAQYMRDLKQKELFRADDMERARGFWKNAAGYGAGFVAQAVDPINVAASFVPIGAPVRAAMLARGAGLGLTRLVTGAVEGAAGAALVEPLVYSQARREGADYGLDDSLMNVAFGGFLGGGLHYVGGKVGDFLNRLQFETRQTMLRAAVNQLANEQVVTNIDTIAQADQRVFSYRVAKESGDMSTLDLSTQQMFDNFGDGSIQVDLKKGVRSVAPSEFRFSEKTGDISPEVFNTKAVGNEAGSWRWKDFAVPHIKKFVDDLKKLGLHAGDLKKVASGFETIAFLTDNAVIKVTNGPFGDELPGLTAKVLFSKKYGSFNVEVAERVHTFEDLVKAEMDKGANRMAAEERVRKDLVRDLAFEQGIRGVFFGDGHEANVGRRIKDGKAVFLDRGGGGGFGHRKAYGTPYFNRLGENDIFLRYFRQGKRLQPEFKANPDKFIKEAGQTVDPNYFNHINDLVLGQHVDVDSLPKIWGGSNAMIKIEKFDPAFDAQKAALDEQYANIEGMLKQRFKLDDGDIAELGMGKEIMAKAKQLGKGIKQAAMCVLGGL